MKNNNLLNPCYCHYKIFCAVLCQTVWFRFLTTQPWVNKCLKRHLKQFTPEDATHGLKGHEKNTSWTRRLIYCPILSIYYCDMLRLNAL